MQKLALKYGCNPNQTPASISVEGGELPIEVLSGNPGYINFMDALNGWQLVRELKAATGIAAATSFKHVSPAGAAVGLPLDNLLRKIYFTGDDDLTPLACAYARARGADRMSSFGDFIALSDECDASTAALILREVSDGVIAPSYTPVALEILSRKRGGKYNIIAIDPAYNPPATERRDIFGITFEQGHNDVQIRPDILAQVLTEAKDIPPDAARDLVIALITLKYTQSNSVCYAKGGQVIGVGAGQQSRIHCTRLAGNKADNWHLRQHPKVLSLPFLWELKRPDRDNTIDLYISDDCGDVLADGAWQQLFRERPEPLTPAERREWLDGVRGVSLASDAFFPFGDNIERAHRSGVQYIAQPGGSMRDQNVIDVCNKYGIAMALIGLRLFHH